jgi:hypothetical protein
MHRRFRSLGAITRVATPIILLACAGRPGGPVALNVTPPQPSTVSSTPISGGMSRITLRWTRHAADTSRRAGQRDAAFGIDMGDVYFANDPSELLRETVAGGLRAAGQELVEDSDVIVTGDYDLFSVRTKTTPLYWDVISTVRASLQVEGSPPAERRSYAIERSRRTYKWPSKELMEQVVGEALTELQRQVQTDTALMAVIARKRGRASNPGSLP